MLKVLIIGSVWPEPQSSGAGTRLLQLMQLFLAQGWRLTFASAAAHSEFMSDLTPMETESVQIELNNSSFDAFVSKLQPDMVLFDRFMTEEQFGWRVEKECHDALRLIETIDLHLLRHAREQAHKQKRDVALYDLYSEVAQREIAAILRSDLSIIISDYELELLISRFAIDEQLLYLCPFMFDEDQVNQHVPSYEDRAHFVTIGNFRHAPNWDSVLWLKQEIWPLVRQSLPQAELHVYGAYMPPKAIALHKPEDGFHIMGRADSVSEIMQSARVVLAPLRFGAGIKTKIADAMLNGAPVASTAIGAEGMSGGLPWCGCIADDSEAFASTAVALYRNQSQWQQAQKNGYAIARQLFNKKANGEALIRRIQTCRENLEQHRMHNFTGMMLRHHHHRSTEFMSRWIEAKSKA
jgi:glycosyltransferase involved in cell wall biosynthesis